MIRRIRTSCVTFELVDEGPFKGATSGLKRNRTLAQAGSRQDAVESALPPERCVPIVLLHGFTGNKQSLRALREALRPSHRVISFDLPWHGGTTVTVREGEMSVERCAKALVEALDTLGVQRFAMFGYSMGGRIALALALSYPERVTQLMLESASAGLKDKAERAARLEADRELAAFAERYGIAAFVRRWEKMALFVSLAKLPAPARAELRQTRLSCSARALAACLQAMSVGAQPCYDDRLGTLRLPALIVAGSLDAKFCAIGRKLARAIAGGRLEIVHGPGHVPHLEPPEEFNALAVNFFGS